MFVGKKEFPPWIDVDVYKRQEEGIGLDQAIRLVSRTCAYTNHTILAEALETWPLSFLEKAVPQLVPIIEHLDKRAKALSHDPKTAIIDSWEQVHICLLYTSLRSIPEISYFAISHNRFLEYFVCAAGKVTDINLSLIHI